MRAIVTVIGKDTVGIIAKVSETLSQNNINILEISQTVLSEFFAMLMLVDLSASALELSDLAAKLDCVGVQVGLKIHVMHEDIFNSMHRI